MVFTATPRLETVLFVLLELMPLKITVRMSKIALNVIIVADLKDMSSKIFVTIVRFVC